MPVSEAMDRHVRMRQIALARGIAARRKIYLDTRFWIAARNAVLADLATAGERKLLHLLRRGVRAGWLICPISESTFIEVMKQTDLRTRVATAALIDELSLGVSLTSGRTRIATEIARFIHATSGEADLYDLQELVWTRLSYAMGALHPTLADLEADDELSLQIEVFDALWEEPLVGIAKRIGADYPRREIDLAESAAAIDAGNKAHQASLVSFERTYRDEIAGAADVCHPMLMEVLTQKAERAGEPVVDVNSPEGRELARVARNLLVFVFDKAETRDGLRSMHIQACLHAGLRWDRSTRFVANHFFDFDHAMGALAYCDAFFTEGFLANLVNARHMKLGAVNGCRTTSNMDEAIAILRAVGGPILPRPSNA